MYKKIEKLENENKELVARDRQIQYKCTEVRELKDQIKKQNETISSLTLKLDELEKAKEKEDEMHDLP